MLGRRRRSPAFYLLVGAVCAGLAMLVAFKFMPGRQAGPAQDQEPQTQLLLTTAEIPFGTPIVLRSDAPEGEEGTPPSYPGRRNGA